MPSSRFATASIRRTAVGGAVAGQAAGGGAGALGDADLSDSKAACCCGVGRTVCAMRSTGSCAKLPAARGSQSAASPPVADECRLPRPPGGGGGTAPPRRAGGGEAFLLRTAQGAVKALERRANDLHRLDHGVEP